MLGDGSRNSETCLSRMFGGIEFLDGKTCTFFAFLFIFFLKKLNKTLATDVLGLD